MDNIESKNQFDREMFDFVEKMKTFIKKSSKEVEIESWGRDDQIKEEEKSLKDVV